MQSLTRRDVDSSCAAIAGPKTASSDPVGHHRGAFIVVEGLDRAGKSTQVARLKAALMSGPEGKSATVMKFPDRTTPVGKILNSYLSNTAADLEDRAVHLLFAANRWEVARKIEMAVQEEGKVVIADRYAWSGMAYSRAKVSDSHGHEPNGDRLKRILRSRSPQVRPTGSVSGLASPTRGGPASARHDNIPLPFA